MSTSEPIVHDLLDDVPVVPTVAVADLGDFLEELAAYQARYAPYFRPDQRAWADLYLRGLLTADVPRKNIEAMVLRLLGAGPAADRQVRAAQYFISEGTWDDAAVLAAHHRLVDETLGEDDGVLLIDGSDVPKQGRHSVGVLRQWCGATGKKDNCQAGVYLGYVSRRGYALLDRRLYLPALWFSDAYRERWRACGIPAGTCFQTKHELAAALVDGVVGERRVRARWLACDEGFGNDPALLDRIAAHGLWYLAEVPCDRLVWPLAEPNGTERPRPWGWVPPRRPRGRGRPHAVARLHPDSPSRVRLDEWAAQVPPARGRRYRILEGSRGPLVAEFAAVPAIQARGGLPGPEGWLVVRRTLATDEAEPVYKYYLSNAPAATPEAALVRVSGLRWPVETCFIEGKGEVGLDQYEVRTWRGWHHHMTLVLLAHFFLMRLVLRLNEREGGPRPGSSRAGAGGVAGAGGRRTGSVAPARDAGEPGRSPTAAASPAAAAGLGRGGGAGAGGLPAAPQDGRLPLPPQAAPAGAPGPRPMSVSLSY